MEGDGPALEALERAARAAGLAGRVTTAVARPGPAAALRRRAQAAFDLVVFDPPRSGAREQAEALAASSVETVIAVSCNPATFGRDAALLTAGGYRLQSVQPVDQFPYTGHLELVARFVR